MSNLKVPTPFAPIDNKACPLNCWRMEPSYCCMAINVTILRLGVWTPSLIPT